MRRRKSCRDKKVVGGGEGAMIERHPHPPGLTCKTGCVWKLVMGWLQNRANGEGKHGNGVGVESTPGLSVGHGWWGGHVAPGWGWREVDIAPEG